MKKIFSVLVVVMLCMSMFAMVSAAEDTFTPSVPGKDAPEIVPVVDPNGEEAIGVIKNEEGEIISYVYTGCLVITPVSQAETSSEIPEEARQILLSVYQQLKNDTMQLPYDKIHTNLDADFMVIRDLFDASFVCEDHPAMLAAEGVVLEIIFDLNVKEDVQVYAMTYNDGEWNPIVSAVNNGDGTLTATFEHLCPVAFSVETERGPADTGSDSLQSLMPWVILLVCSATALAAMVLLRRKQVK